jgi:hypothetical protein
VRTSLNPLGLGLGLGDFSFELLDFALERLNLVS